MEGLLAVNILIECEAHSSSLSAEVGFAVDEESQFAECKALVDNISLF